MGLLILLIDTDAFMIHFFVTERWTLSCDVSVLIHISIKLL